MPYIGKSPQFGVRSRFYFTQSSAGGTSVSGSDDNSKTLKFSDGEFVDVMLNGVTLVAGTDYNTTTANTIAGLSALANGDVVEVVVYDVFSVSDTVSAKNGGTFAGNVTFTGDVNGTPKGNSNLIINGAMQVAQRGTSTTGITSGTAYNTVDRFQFGVTNAGTYTIAQSTTTPDGFGFSTKIDCTTADTSVAADHVVFFQQRIEGQNLQLLQKGTSSAKKHTLSFYVKSNKTGTYTASIRDNDNSRSISRIYTVDSADTWERKTITFDGDTTGALDNDNEYSYQIRWYLAAGSNYTSGTMNSTWASQTTANLVSSSQVNLSDSTDNEWLITGVQLEVGEQATPFQHEDIGITLAKCQRYYEQLGPALINAGSGYSYALASYDGTSSNMWLTIDFATTKRAAPTSLDFLNGYAWVGTPSVFGYGTNGITMHRAGAGIVKNTGASATGVNTVEVDCEL